MNTIDLFFQVCHWPSIRDFIQQIGQTNDQVEINKLACEVSERLSVILNQLHTFDEEVINPLRESGGIVLEPPEDTIFEERYTFRSWDISCLWHLYTLVVLLMGWMMEVVHRYMGIVDPDLEKWLWETSRQVWLSSHYTRQFFPFGGRQIAATLMFSYESGDETERTFVRDALIRAHQHRRSNPARGFNHHSISLICAILTGQIPRLVT
jgi:hypothetical protein